MLKILVPMKFLLLICSCCLFLSSGTRVLGKTESIQNFLSQDLEITEQPDKSCPPDVATLSDRLIEDIADYGNRVIQTTQDSHQDEGIYNYIIFAGKAELQPLGLPQIDYGFSAADATEQIFFTTKEREYFKLRKSERQTYHWLFVTLTESGWHLVAMFSRFGHETQDTPPTPPQESSKGIIGQAASLWLRDCRADSLR